MEEAVARINKAVFKLERGLVPNKVRNLPPHPMVGGLVPNKVRSLPPGHPG